MLRFGAVKVFADGSAGGRTAAVSEPYLQGGTGMFIFPGEVLHELFARYHRQGWQLGIHTMGDRAIGIMLDAVEAAMRARPRPDVRHRIEHCTWPTAESWPKGAINSASIRSPTRPTASTGPTTPGCSTCCCFSCIAKLAAQSS